MSTTGWLSCAHKVVIYSAPASVHEGRGRPVSEVIGRHERDARKKAALARARQRLGASLASTEGHETITSLRLSRGLSQAALAEQIGQRQPYVARLEKDGQDLRASTISKLSKALGVSTDVIIKLTQPRHEQ